MSDDYISSGAFEHDLTALLSAASSPQTIIEPARTARHIESLPEPARTEVRAYQKLYETRGVPELGPAASTSFGYNLEWDYGDELESLFETPTGLAMARTAIGFGDNGGGLMFFILGDGGVAALDVGAVLEWQWTRFESFPQCIWVLLHAAAVEAGTFGADELRARVSEFGCARAAATFDIDTALLPPFEVGRPHQPPAWLRD